MERRHMTPQILHSDALELALRIKNWENHESWQGFLIHAGSWCAAWPEVGRPTQKRKMVQETFCISPSLPKLTTIRRWVRSITSYTTRWHIANQFRKRPRLASRSTITTRAG
jgi:hypothetical protein